MNSGSEEISSNCSLCTFCARLNFELQFFPSLDEPGLCTLQVHCFVRAPPPPEELPMQIKMVRALDLQYVFRWHCIGKEHPCPLEQENKQAFSIYKITVCIFYPWAEGDSDTRTVDCSHSCAILIAANSQRRGQVAVSNGSFLSKQCVHNKVQQSPRVLPEA